MKNELVLAVPTELLRPMLVRRGLITEHTAEILSLVHGRRVFLPRAEAETDSAFRQIIPYVAVTRGGEVFSTRRLRSGTESRLHGLISLGIGGHIDKNRDGDDGETLMRALRRELSEELGCELGSAWLYDTVEHDYPDFHLTMDSFVTRLGAGAEPACRPGVHDELRWLSRDELMDVAWLPADVELARGLVYYWDEALADQLL